MNRKTLLIILGIVVVLCCCAAAAGILLVTQAGRFIAQTVSVDPAKTSAVAQSITDYTLPSGYKEQFSMSLMGFDLAAFSTQDDKQMIMLFQAPANSGLTTQQMEDQMRQAQQQQTGQNYTLEKVGTQSAYIRGETTEFTIYEGKDKNGVAIRELVGAFKGKSGTAILMIVGPIDSWDTAAVDSFVKSLR